MKEKKEKKDLPREEGKDGEGLVRLNRFLALCGIASRRKADQLIREGHVEVDGETVTDPAFRVDPAEQKVFLDGERLKAGRRYYYLLNKPRGVVCTNHPGEKHPRAVDLLPRRPGVRLFCVGRLDMDSEGLILVTNDGDFANRVSHPRYGVEKTYSVQVRGKVDAKALEKARGGIWLSEGRTRGMKILVRKRSSNRTHLLVTISEGRNREIRRTFARLGLPVIRLKRVRIGGLTIHKLKPGAFRPLTAQEVRDLLSPAEGRTREERKGGRWRGRRNTGKKR